jgi:predicted RNase H-like HicB family nuclease
MRNVTIIIERQPENIYLATSDDLPGFNVESEDKEKIFKLSRELALEFLRVDGEIGPNDKVTFDFEVRE